MEFQSNYERLLFAALRIRLVEERIAEIYPSDRIQSPVHLSNGQEHVVVGLCDGLQKDDQVFGTYRSHALYLARGGDLNKMFAELYGRATGCGLGRAGSMHLSAPEVGVMGSSAIVASTIPHAVGAALAAKVKKADNITVAFFGDGATGEGVYHESLNFAAKHRLPILFICENNSYAIMSKVDDLHSFAIHQHAQAYGIESIKFDDGTNLSALADLGATLAKKVRSGSGPILVEVKTHRYVRHVGPGHDDHMGYRDQSEHSQWEATDPIIQGYDLRERFEPLINREIDEAVAFAEASPYPDANTLHDHVF